MKKRVITALILIALLLPILSVCSFSEESVSEAIPYVLDRAGLLTSEQVEELQQKASELTERYSCGVYIYILDDFSKYTEYRLGIKECAQQLYEQFNLGVDNGTGNRDLVLLVISMAERDYTIYTNGYKGNEIFNNSGITSLENTMVPYLRENNWYGGFSAFMARTEELMENPMEEDLNAYSPYTTETYGYERDETGVSPAAVLITIVLPCLAAFITCSIFKSQMTNAQGSTMADNYIASARGVEMTDRRDVFLNRTVTRTVIQTDSGRAGGGFSGGSGGHFSGGASGHSGKF